MKNILVTSLIFLASTLEYQNLVAQATIVAHAEKEFTETFVRRKILETRDHKIMVVRFNNDKFSFDAYDENLNPASSNSNKMEEDETIIDIVTIRNIPFLFSKSYDKQSDQSKVFAYEIESSSCKLLPQKLIVSYSKFDVGGISMAKSRDENLLCFMINPGEKSKYEKYFFTVCDFNLNVVWSKDVEFDFKDWKMSNPSGLRVSQAGDVYFAALSHTKVATKTVVDNENMLLFRISDHGLKTRKLDFLETPYYVDWHSFLFDFLNEDNLACAANVKLRADKDYPVFSTFKVNVNSFEITDMKNPDFKPEENRDKLSYVNKKMILGFSPTYLSIDSSETALLLAHQYTMTAWTDPQTHVTNRTYSYYATCFAELDGGLNSDYLLLLPMYLGDLGDRNHAGIQEGRVGNNLVMLYNEMPANISATKLSELKNFDYKKSVPCIVIASDKGLKKYSLANSSMADYHLLLGTFLASKNGSVYCIQYQGTKNPLGKKHAEMICRISGM